MTSKDGIAEADTSITTKKSVTIFPYDDKDEIMTSDPFQAAITLWQNYANAWFRLWSLNTLQQYQEKSVFSVLAYLCKEKSAKDHKFRAMDEFAFQSIVHTRQVNRPCCLPARTRLYIVP